MSKICYSCKNELEFNLFREGHNKCKKCERNAIKCEHDKVKYNCVACCGTQICSHNKRKNRCKECNGKEICVHSKSKYFCKECKGKGICEHDKIKQHCKECKGASICEHDKRKSRCKECGGGSICEHNKRKDICRECGGNQLCEHDKIKQHCKECKGASICEHNKVRSRCRECGGGTICPHNKQKSTCVICNPNCSCIECKSILVDKRSKFYPLCQACFCNKYPDHKKSTLYKIKERYLRDELRLRFPDKDINMVFDKAVDGGCSKKRPDVLIDLLLYSIIIECDEDQHKNYECENKRTMQLFEDLGERPLILIRFNPDSYMENKKKIEGCFKPLIKIEDIHKKKFYELNEEEWNRRVDILEEVIREKIREDIPEKEVEEIKLFYDVF